LSGYVALADPTHSGSAAVAYMMVIQRAMADAENDLFIARPDLKAAPKAQRAKDPAYTAALAAGFKKGQGQLLLIAANARYFTDSATQVPNDVGNGEAAAGTSIDFYGRVYEETVGTGRLRFVLPEAATAITPDPVAILRGAPHPELARQFVEFLLSPEAQRLWDLKVGVPGVLGMPTQRALRRMPIRRDVYGDSSAQRADWSDPQVNPFTAARGFNQRGEWMKPFGELRQIWAAEWIDSRDALRQAYDAVRAVHDVTRRQQLLAELADLPIDVAQVDALINQEKEVAKAKGDVDLWRAQMRIRLAKEFRAHYQAVEARAGTIR
jgi:iron(III) transport system substrate-binding protein